MNQEDREFLKALQNEMLTQDNVCQANPRFWVVMQTVKDYWVEDDIAGFCIYDSNACGTVFEGNIEEVAQWIKEEFSDVVVKCEHDGGFLDIACNDGEEYYIDSMSEVKDFVETYSSNEYSFCYYREREEIVPNTMFLTNRECKEHIESNSHHYNQTAHSYAMTAWRSSQVERLYKILETTNWDNA